MKVEKNMKKSFKLLFLFLFLTICVASVSAYNNAKVMEQAVTASVSDSPVVIPIGTTCGLQMNVKGALVVGTERDSSLKAGDIIMEVDNISVSSPQDIMNIISKQSKTVSLKVSRDGEILSVLAKPYFDTESKSYKLGAWIKEKIAGIGTISFYEPETGRYAAVGHGIYEPETKTLINVKEGSLLECEIESLDPGVSGTPGQICGTIYNIKNSIGTIEKNNEYGIYGHSLDLQNLKTSKSYSIAKISDVKKGDAYILSSLAGKKPEKFHIRITKLKKQDNAEIKGIEFKVTDKKLLKECGGIIQGMSGSPIIQNNKLVGCVTHVIIDNPEEGYGVYAKWMYDKMSELCEN